MTRLPVWQAMGQVRQAGRSLERLQSRALGSAEPGRLGQQRLGGIMVLVPAALPKSRIVLGARPRGLDRRLARRLRRRYRPLER